MLDVSPRILLPNSAVGLRNRWRTVVSLIACCVFISFGEEHVGTSSFSTMFYEKLLEQLVNSILNSGAWSSCHLVRQRSDVSHRSTGYILLLRVSFIFCFSLICNLRISRADHNILTCECLQCNLLEFLPLLGWQPGQPHIHHAVKCCEMLTNFREASQRMLFERAKTASKERFLS